MRILLIGRGHLGAFLRERLRIPAELHYTGELAALEAPALARLAPEAIVNTAGKTDLRWCEDNPREAWRCNVVAPLALWRAIAAAWLPETIFVHLSSGCVWDGPYQEDGTPFGPDDPPRPACFYSWTKAACDALLLREVGGRPLALLRPRQVYSPRPSPRNTLTKLRTYPRLIDTPNSMASAETIAATIEQVVALAPAKRLRGRILNVYDRGVTSPYQVGVLLAAAGLRAPPERLTKGELDQFLKPKRVDTVLNDPFFEQLVKPPKVQEELRRVIALYAQSDIPHPAN
jgi:dTDP-4-dehydrorhamnose reductase